MAVFPPSPSNQALQLATAVVVSLAVGAAAVLGYQTLQEGTRVSNLKRSIPDSTSDQPAARKRRPSSLIPAPASTVGLGLPNADAEDVRNAALARRAQAGDFDEELILEQLARNRAFLTPTGLDRLRGAFVIVVGCGGVGSHCAAALARSGVGRLRLVDFDQVTLSSLNRHSVATLADVGLPKVQCLHRRLVAVTPWVAFDLRLEKFDADSAPRLLGPWEGGDLQKSRPDFVVDAIDNIDTKVQLLKFCHDHKLPVISSMGAGCKSDPTKIVVGDIGTSTDDGLSRATRRRLKLLGVTSGIPVVYSVEKAGPGKAELLPLPEEEFEKGQVGDLGVLPDFRVRILPVLGTMPAVFGYTLANHIILQISGYPSDYVPFKGRDKMYDSIQAFIQGAEEKIVRAQGGATNPDLAIGLKVPINPGDIAFSVEELFRGRSAITGLPTKLVLVRWRKPEGSTLIQIGDQKSAALSLRDLVCMTKEEATRHLKEVILGNKSPEDLYGPVVVEKIDSKLRDPRSFEGYC
ncbi:hypothetical protein VTK73DRAFT_2746 [Phialemonium thermophilum]|uniref:THIF-type NAD/FAD binding fold domain-containing protein n=1 Tax=Phialemonium thermophilum TaxID=223376 RepID=A0ABR3Y166_9PEZI